MTNNLINSETFCILPWIHQFVHTNGDVLPCCVADYKSPLGNVKKNKMADIWNNNDYKQLRLDMLSGVKNSKCKSCYFFNDNPRLNANRNFSEFFYLVNNTMEDGSLPDMNIKYLDIRWSNICNLKCRTCGEWNSSSWAAENNKFGSKHQEHVFQKAFNNNSNLLEQLSLSEVKEIYFAGGEPLLMEEHYALLEKLLLMNKTNITLRYNTNLTVLDYKDINVLKLWNKFDNVIVNASLDSWGKRAEYIRHGFSWDSIKENIMLIQNHANRVKLGCNIVVSVFNIMTLIEFLDELKKFGMLDNTNSKNISFYYLIDPSHFSVDLLSIETKLQIKKSILEYVSTLDIEHKNLKNKLTELALKLNQPTIKYLKKTFIENVSKIDQRRNESFVSVFPELADWFTNN